MLVNPKRNKRCTELKKINPKVIGLTILLLGLLIGGGLTVQTGRGDPTLTPNPPEDDGGG